jgi:TPR repeat protein
MGKGVSQDNAQAAEWFRKAADQGNSFAQNELGKLYYVGTTIPKDYAQAAEWFRKAAEQGLAEAQYKLGFQYDQGEGVPKDHEQAIVWYQKAAYQGNSRAIELLGYKSLMESGKAVPVKIIDRKTSETGYSYVVPAYSHSSSNTNLNCYAYSNSVNCSGRTRTDGYSTAPREISYDVSGATYSLLLPDGRIAVVNCESKFHEKFDYINRRDCRMPLVSDIQVEFKGKNAKLIWAVSIDGRTFESETYKIIAVRDR